jgi:L-lactate dehydrogenase complex protein LldG
MMTPSQRVAMRALVGAATQQAYLPGSGSGHPGTLDPTPEIADPSARIARFRREFEALAGIVHEASSLAGVLAVISRLASTVATSRVLAWNDDAVGLAGLQAGLTAAGLTLAEPHLDQAGARRDTQMAELDAASIGITGVDAAIADTGSLIVASGPGRPRLASLLTLVHVAIVRPRDIVTSLRSLIRARPSLVTRGSNFVCITGPSRTADIEHTLSRGVHGPGEVHVILVSDQ